ncbi:acyl-CoA dehydrogenase family protein [Hydrogenophaga sp. BPS33]|uniref:acyl-CoA dehydrogenase family protein n=1 Tax=Hydrogenophaga sp. BPS33 TaxID=2651974 RepID=UPI001320412B|nr:acyl-CoA dehydrogenase family protein [Hydrogenophaga sp. BPS33]QHE88115.1 acyl-CoA dehydrogenase [Hydrogenophaga sp. BPS33]
MSTLSTEDSASLGDALQRLLQDRYGFADARRRDLTTPAERLPVIWAPLVELGLTGLVVPEAQGGFGGGPADVQRVQRELGRALVVSPWLGVALCAHAIQHAASAAQQGAWLPAIAEGRMTVALARDDVQALNETPVPALAQAANGGWRLDGRKANVLHASAVSHLLVSACLTDGSAAWFLVDAAQAGVERQSHRLVDHAWSADVSFANAQAERLDAPAPNLDGGLRALEVAACCAEMVGGAEAALELTVQYLRTRQQFGQPLGDYQALRHRVAEMAIALEQLRSAEALALEATEAQAPAEQTRLGAQALLVGSESATWVQRQAIQLHGGMGMTEEFAVGHHYRRQLVINALTGGEAAALSALAGNA